MMISMSLYYCPFLLHFHIFFLQRYFIFILQFYVILNDIIYSITKNIFYLFYYNWHFNYYLLCSPYCNCSVPSQLRVKMHSTSPSVMAFCLICLGILAKTCQNTSRDTTFWIVTLHQITFLKSPYRNVRFFRIL